MPRFDFDPNHVLCGRVARQTYRLTFGEWKYRAVERVQIRTNVRGLAAIQVAIEKVLERLEEGLPENVPARLVMRDDRGGELWCEDDEMERGEWLERMLISAELVAYEPAGKLFEPDPVEAGV